MKAHHMPSRRLQTCLPAKLSRREIVLGSTAASALALGNQRVVAHPPVQTLKLGDAMVTVLSDGTMTLPRTFVLPSADAKDVSGLLSGRVDVTSGFKAEINVVVVQHAAHTMLIDCGGTADFMPTLGGFPERLERAGIKPEIVTHVIFTHAHADHLWGAVDSFDDARFANARHIISATELDFWRANDVANRVPDAMKPMAAGTQRRIELLSSRFETSRPGTDILPGVTLLDTAGHSPGHLSVLLRFGSDALLVGGDALTHAIVSFERPDWTWGPDMDGTQAAKTRRRLLDQLATDRSRLLGYHLPWPGSGRVERKDQAYRFVQE